MTTSLLLRLQAEHAFDPTPLREDLSVYHVPFDELTGHRGVESEIDRSVRVPERVAVVGPSGGGKSSAMFHALGPLAEGIAPIRLPLRDEGAEIATSPRAFASHLTRTVARYAEHAGALSEEERDGFLAATADQRPVGGRERRISVHAAPHWLVAGVELTAQLRSVSRPSLVRTSAAETIEQARGVLEVIGAKGLIPVLVVDDSDAWLQPLEGQGRARLISGFFGGIVRMVTEELPAALVVAVHERYLTLRAYRASAGFIESTIHLPRLPDAGALGVLLARRVELHGGAGVEEVAHPEALGEAFRYYTESTDGNLRQVMLVLHTALQAACQDDAELLTRARVSAAIAECEARFGTQRRRRVPRE